MLFLNVEEKNRTLVTSCEPDNVGFRTDDEVMSIHNLGKVIVEPESASCGNKTVKFCSWVSFK